MASYLFNHKIALLKFKFNVIFADSIREGLTEQGLWADFVEISESKEEAVTYVEGAGAMISHFEKSDFYVLSFDWDAKPCRIAHEAFHLTYRIMDERNITLSNTSEEIFAYTIDYLVRQIMDMQKKAIKKKNDQG